MPPKPAKPSSNPFPTVILLTIIANIGLTIHHNRQTAVFHKSIQDQLDELGKDIDNITYVKGALFGKRVVARSLLWDEGIGERGKGISISKQWKGGLVRGFGDGEAEGRVFKGEEGEIDKHIYIDGAFVGLKRKWRVNLDGMNEIWDDGGRFRKWYDSRY